MFSAAAKFIAPNLAGTLLNMPALLRKINHWSMANCDGELYHLGGLKFNPKFKTDQRTVLGRRGWRPTIQTWVLIDYLPEHGNKVSEKFELI
ncbi:MAG: hypothetical protein AAF810_04895 [Cyanobacteria bacterium P01_D01_bin.36]